MLKPDHIIIKLLVLSFASSRGCRGRELGSIDDYYNLLLYIVAATSASLLFHSCYIKCWLILPPCCKTRRKMLVFDRPSIIPSYPCTSILQSTIQPPLSI